MSENMYEISAGIVAVFDFYGAPQATSNIHFFQMQKLGCLL